MVSLKLQKTVMLNKSITESLFLTLVNISCLEEGDTHWTLYRIGWDDACYTYMYMYMYMYMKPSVRGVTRMYQRTAEG